MNYKELFLIVALLATVYAEYKSYKNYKVYKTVPESKDGVEVLKELRRNGWFFWNDISVNSDVKVMVAPERQKEFEDKLSAAGLSSQVIIEDVQQYVLFT